jgi:DeoR family transcriptional regulator, fructose operon transcriptional repressor
LFLQVLLLIFVKYLSKQKNQRLYSRNQMNFQERKLIILKLLNDRGSVHAKELMQQLGASEITIRRDLTLLEEKGLLARTHGGAMRPELAKDPDLLTFKGKATQNTDAKNYIARLASGEVQKGDVIFMDCGSTVYGLCPYLKQKEIKVITNSLPVVYQLMNSSCSVTIIGGELDAQRQALHGRTAIKQIQAYRANKAFIGTDGLSLQNGLSSLSENESEISLTMAEQAQQTILLADSSKFEKDSFRYFAPLSIVSKLFTDKNLDYDIYKKYQNAAVEIIK